MSRPRSRPGLALIALVALGCGAEDEATVAPATSTETHAVVAEPAARVSSVQGAVSSSGQPMRPGDALEAGDEVEVAAGASLEITLERGTTIRLRGPGALRLPELPARAVWILGGSVLLREVATESTGERVALRVATPTATIEVSGATEMTLDVQPTATRIVALQGALEVSGHECDTRHRPRVVTLQPGQQMRVAERMEDATPGPARAEEVGSLPALEPAAAPPTGGLHRLDEALRWLELEERRGHELTGRHRIAVQAGDTATAAEAQRQLVAHAQLVYQLRQLVLARWERIAIGTRAMNDMVQWTTEVVPRGERLANLIGS
jgi:hypothetical protein